MEALGLLLHGFAVLLTWKTLVLMMVGLVLGIFVGVLPGLGGPNGVAILLPLTFTMDPTSAIVMLSCIYWGALFGGAITSILFNIPGEAWSVATTFDGYPMAQQGRAAEALTAAFTSSFIGSLVAVLLITFLAPMISSFALKFGPPEFFAVYLLTFCSFVGLGREAKHKTVISMSLGLLLAGVGMDTVSGNLRMTFGSSELLRGINFLVAVIGLFGISEILLTMEERLALRGHAASISLRVVLSVWKDLPKYWVTLLRSSFIGCWLGITPGGAIAASFMGYNLAKRFAKDPESFGKGRIEGVFAPETAAHASGTSALLPMLALGIPGSGTAAILLGGLMVWGTQSGSAAVRGAQGLRLGPDRLDVSRQCRRPRAGADDGADLRLDPAGAVRRGGADDRGVLRDRRLCDPERDVRHLANAGLRRRRLRLQEDRHPARAVHPGARPRQPRRGCLPPVDDRVRRQQSWPRLFGQRPAGFKWIPAGLC
ncbi:TctA family transporter [Bradyrhizobium japonicum]